LENVLNNRVVKQQQVTERKAIIIDKNKHKRENTAADNGAHPMPPWFYNHDDGKTRPKQVYRLKQARRQRRIPTPSKS